MDKKILIPLVLGLIVIAVVGYMVYTRNQTESNPSPVPPGYTKSESGEEFLPQQTPERVGTEYDTDGFPQKSISVIQTSKDTPILFELTNNTSTVLEVRLIKTPDGEWPEDPPRSIPPQESFPFYLDRVGTYTIQTVQNPDQQLDIIVENQ